MNALLVISAAISYTVGGYFMKHADGFSQFAPSVAVLALFCLGATLQIFAMRQQEMMSIYMIVLGFEAVCAFLFGALLLGETITWQKLLGGIIICVGVAVLRH